MHKRPYFGSVRISDNKQKKGVSLKEQKSDISRFAQSRGIDIVRWFVEVRTAAKTGRPVFDGMLAQLKKGDANGLIMHKIDRSARNLEDWLVVGKLIDSGIDVQFAYEPVDLHTTGGRFSADILAVAAAHYIRNLRDEAKKGFYGRLKQGIYPLPAPVGYLNKGKGKPKTIDPVMAPFVRFAFERYATGLVSLRMLAEELRVRGWRRKGGDAIRTNRLADTLHNPFYYGLIRVERTGEYFQGIHEPLITKSLFDRVQKVLTGKFATRTVRHEFLFRHLLRCGECDLGLTGERQKGHVYYRCHGERCTGTSLREEVVDAHIYEELALLQCDEQEIRDIRDMIAEERLRTQSNRAHRENALHMQLSKSDERLNRLADALVDGLLDKGAFNARKAALLREQASVREQLEIASEQEPIADRVAQYFELGITAYSSYKKHIPDEQRATIEKITSNRVVHGKTPVITLKIPFQEITKARKLLNSAPYRSTPRTRARKIFAALKDAVEKEIAAATSLKS